MSTLQTNARNAIVDAINNTIGAGGQLEILAADGTTVIARWIWTAAPYGTASNGVKSLTSPVSATVAALATGVATTGRWRTSGNADVITGYTVGLSGTQIIIDNTSVNAGQNVTLNFAASTITAPTS
jgi:hypothetical protein